MFFFEKMNQKTFAPWRAWRNPKQTVSAREQEFFASFFQKGSLLRCA
jgi:hypothetical protein